MCGIAGILRSDGASPDASELSRLAAALAHRGPDDEGLHRDGPMGLVHRRLSILDLSPAGHQPMSNEDGTVWVVYNGQLFDFEPLRERLLSQGHRFRSRTDTEILVHLYEERGDDLVEDIDGMFAFAIWDARRHRLLLARDRLGIKPLYYLQRGTSFAFASEARALRALSWAATSVDPLALVQYLFQSSVPGTASLEGFKQVRPGHVLVVEKGGTAVRGYWAPPPEAPASGILPFPDAVAALQQRLRAAVRSHLVADVPVGTLLSGGLDSSAVTREAREALTGALHTFAVRFADGTTADEGPAARAVADALGTVHHEVVIGPDDLRSFESWATAADEPFGVASAFALGVLARAAREHVKVVLTGDGSDEIFGGYPWRHASVSVLDPHALARALALTGVRAVRAARGAGPGLLRQLRYRLARFRRPADRYAEVTSAFTPEEMQCVVHSDLRATVERAWAEHPVRLAYANEATIDAVNRRLRADLQTTLVDEMLTKVDRTTMGAGLEARVPFLDRSLVEWALLQPGRYKVRGATGKRLIRAALAPVLPDTARAPKRGFSPPVGSWLLGPLRELTHDVLAPSAIGRRGLLRPDSVQRILKAHFSGRADRSRQIFTLLALELWLNGVEPKHRAPAVLRAFA